MSMAFLSDSKCFSVCNAQLCLLNRMPWLRKRQLPLILAIFITSSIFIRTQYSAIPPADLDLDLQWWMSDVGLVMFGSGHLLPFLPAPARSPE